MAPTPIRQNWFIYVEKSYWLRCLRYGKFWRWHTPTNANSVWSFHEQCDSFIMFLAPSKATSVILNMFVIRIEHKTVSTHKILSHAKRSNIWYVAGTNFFFCWKTREVSCVNVGMSFMASRRFRITEHKVRTLHSRRISFVGGFLFFCGHWLCFYFYAGKCEGCRIGIWRISKFVYMA